MLDPKQEEDYSIQKRRQEGLYKTYYKVRKYNKLDIHKGFQKDIERWILRLTLSWVRIS